MSNPKCLHGCFTTKQEILHRNMDFKSLLKLGNPGTLGAPPEFCVIPVFPNYLSLHSPACALHIFSALVSAALPLWFCSLYHTPQNISQDLELVLKTCRQNTFAMSLYQVTKFYTTNTSTGTNMPPKGACHMTCGKYLCWKLMRRSQSDKPRLCDTKTDG